MSIEALAIGEIGIDIIATGFNKIPKSWSEPEKLSNIGIYVAGAAGYFIECLSRLGIKCGIIGKIGEDEWGQIIKRGLEKEKVLTKYLIIDKNKATEVTLILIFKNKKKIQFVTPIPQLEFNEINFEIFKGIKLLHFSGYLLLPSLWGKPAIEIFKIAKENKALTSLNPQASITGDWITPFKNNLLEYVDVLTLDKEEARKITKQKNLRKCIKKLHDMGSKIIAIKAGKEGCILSNGKEILKIPSYKVNVVCTVGAGDAFDAAFLYALLNNWKLEYAGKFANAAAALSTTKMDCKEGFENIEQIKDFMKKYEI